MRYKEPGITMIFPMIIGFLLCNIIFPTIILAQIFSWMGCLTKNNLWNATEESLWTFSFLVLLVISISTYNNMFLLEQTAKNESIKTIAATLNGTSHKDLNPSKNWALILGNEAHGVTESLLDSADEQVSIPKLGNMESLNVGVAGSVLIDRFCTK